MRTLSAPRRRLRVPPGRARAAAALMSTISPRAVFVTRETDYELLLARHAARG